MAITMAEKIATDLGEMGKDERLQFFVEKYYTGSMARTLVILINYNIYI